jgi:hypothetical protein
MHNRVRVSCGGLGRIVHPDGERWLLGLNRNALRKGERVLKPLGGALAYDPAALPSGLAATPEDATRTELRLFLPSDQIEAFTAWFATRTGRETTPFRELREELVDEYRALPSLSRADVAIRYERTVRTERLSDRVGVTGVLTVSLQEVYHVLLTHPDYRAQLIAAPPSSGLYWVTPEQVRAGRLDADTEIQARVLLE